MFTGQEVQNKSGSSQYLVRSRAGFRELDVEIVECKGKGHPDTLADDLADALSNAYSLFTRQECGAILHHNFDKLCLLGGAADVQFGSGRLTKKIRILVNGRVSFGLADRPLPIRDVIANTCRRFFAERLPLLPFDDSFDIEYNLNTASSPGRVDTPGGAPNSRHYWFTPRSIEDLPERKLLRANDTSLGSGYAPLSKCEQFVLDLVSALSVRPSSAPEWMGTDIKVMATSSPNGISIVACIPQIARYVASRDQYAQNLSWLKGHCLTLAQHMLGDTDVSFLLNARDNPDADELYLTASGTSLESGDEGVVGRGNRLNGLITPMRPMNLEGFSGKNPVYHVGKLYNAMSTDIAKRLHFEFGGRIAVFLVSAAGAPLAEPWRVVIETEAAVEYEVIVARVKTMLAGFPALTERILIRDLNRGYL